MCRNPEDTFSEMDINYLLKITAFQMYKVTVIKRQASLTKDSRQQ